MYQNHGFYKEDLLLIITQNVKDSSIIYEYVNIFHLKDVRGGFKYSHYTCLSALYNHKSCS